MLNTNFTNIRDIQRNYKKVSEEVNKTDKPLIVMSKNQPQFVVVSLKTLDRLQESETQNSAQKLLSIAVLARKIGIKGPKDLSEKHNEYAWDE